MEREKHMLDNSLRTVPAGENTRGVGVMRSVHRSLVLLAVLSMPVHAQPSLTVTAGGAGSLNAIPGDTIGLNVDMSGLATELAVSASYEVGFSAAGLQYDTYQWTLPMATGAGDDLSIPALASLPLVVTDTVFGGAGSPIDVHFDNFTSAGGVGNGTLTTMTLRVPIDFPSPSTVTIDIVPGDFVFSDSPFAETPAAGAAFALNVSGAAAVIDVALRAVETPTAPEEGTLPTGVTETCLGGDVFIEVWVSEIDGGTEGIAGGSVDLLFNTTATSATAIDHGGVFTSGTSGTIDNIAGLVNDVGGATLTAGRGVAPNWALLARVSMNTSATGLATFSMTHGAFSFALAGGMPPLANANVDVTETLVLNVVGVDDGNGCTSDVCNADGTVSHADTTPPGQCCAPLTGILTPIDDGDACTSDVCNADGTVSHTDTTPPGQCCDPLTGILTPIDDMIACTLDACDTLTGQVTHSPDDAACDDLNTCTTDTCDPATGCINRSVIYDLDLSNTIDLGDFALFAPHFATFTGDPAYLACADFYFDGVIEAADVSFFGAALGLLCDDPAIPLPDAAHTPPLPCPAAGPPLAPTPELGDSFLRVRALVSMSSSKSGTAERLSRSRTGWARVGDEFVVEIWVRMFGSAPAGVTGGTVDVLVDPALATLTGATVDPNFVMFAMGDFDPKSGVVSGVGGATLDGNVAVDEWVRFATVRLEAVGAGLLGIEVAPGTMPFSEYSVGSVDADSVFMHDARITIEDRRSHGLQR